MAPEKLGRAGTFTDFFALFPSSWISCRGFEYVPYPLPTNTCMDSSPDGPAEKRISSQLAKDSIAPLREGFRFQPWRRLSPCSRPPLFRCPSVGGHTKSRMIVVSATRLFPSAPLRSWPSCSKPHCVFPTHRPPPWSIAEGGIATNCGFIVRHCSNEAFLEMGITEEDGGADELWSKH